MLLIFPFFLQASLVSIKGNWKDSSLKDEALVFFEKVEPSLLDNVKTALESADEDDKSQILDKLSNIVKQPLFGLLNLSLSLRFYQPAASLRFPKKGSPNLHGWNILKKLNIDISVHKIKNLQYTLINLLEKHKTPQKKINFLKQTSFSYESLLKTNQKNNLNFGSQHLSNRYSSDYFYSGINNRVVKHHYFDILNGLIEEYKTSKLFSFSKNLLSKNGYREPHYYTEQPQSMQNLVPHNRDKIVERWSNPNFKLNNYVDILKSKKPFIDINIFFDIKSPESPALLNWAIEYTLKSSPLTFNVSLNFDPKNKTEKHIGYAWHQAVDTLGVRNAVIFMIDGFKRNNFKRAYKATIPTLGWKRLKENMKPDSKHSKRISKELSYFQEKNLTVGVAINGEFIQERPIFPIVENKLFQCIDRIRNEKSNFDFSNYLNWSSKNAIKMETSKFPVEITYNNYVTIHGFSGEVIKSATSKITSLFDKIPNKNKSFKYPVIILNNDKKNTSQFDVDISEFSDEEIRFLKANKNDVFTIVGPLVFQGACLSSDQIRFAEDYIEYVFITSNLETDLKSENILLSLFLRSTDALNGIERKSIGDNLFSLTKIELTNDSPLTWQIIDDPLSSHAPIIFDMMTHVYESGAASIAYYPNIIKTEYKSIPPHFLYEFKSAFDKDDIEIDGENYLVRTSPYWSTLKERAKNDDASRTEFTCTSLVTSSLLSKKGAKIKIHDFIATSSNDIGYFSPSLPVGSYETEGMSAKSDSVDSSFVVDSFVPHVKFYFANNKDIQLSKSKSKMLNLVICPSGDSEESVTSIKVLLYSILTNKKENVKVNLFAITSNPFESIKNMSTKVVPSYLPHFFRTPFVNENQLQKNLKFILSDFYLPNNERYLFVDSNMVFKGDASRFLRLDMGDDSIVAAPVMTDSWFHNRGKRWNSRESLMMRFSRPFHTPNVVWLDMRRWTDNHIGGRFRLFLSLVGYTNNHDDDFCETIFNNIQMYAQFITLPEEVAFNSERSPHCLAKKALAIDFSSPEGARLAKIKYEKIKKQALDFFN